MVPAHERQKAGFLLRFDPFPFRRHFPFQSKNIRKSVLDNSYMYSRWVSPSDVERAREGGGGAVTLGFLGGDVPLGPWNP